MAPPPQPCWAISPHNLRHHLVLLLFTVAAAAVTTTRADTTGTPAPSPSAALENQPSSSSAAASEFLRSRCATTLYPSLCYASLLPYASDYLHTGGAATLARVASGVAAAHLRALSAQVKGILLHRGDPGQPADAAAALRDCASTISAAANLAKQSAAELSRLVDAGESSREARWEVSNAKTWLSAAMTNEGTCADGLEEAAGGAKASSPDGKEVSDGVVSVRQYTSNALALVNGIQL
ncbi:hypothetical protein HU200_021026 [Digitaria exilis]|uniref:Pectinesterase inhibitor domain-containing protein n=1 Tax=Digitaria exilis TaxID=1010633 RepID=A0A835EZP6_9POAL|nr:hypothetical protein HU200_021026 [Digitaria exilis]CAB3472601.1 unnamed protein product [Digitaria exilis]